MRALRFTKLSDDGAFLQFRDSDGIDYQIEIGDEIRDAVRQWKERPKPQEQDSNQNLTVAEIQSRIRAGITAEDLAQVTGIELGRIRKYEQPVLQERYFISEKARQTEIRRARGSANFSDIVQERVANGGGDVTSMRWDSWRREDGRWNIALSFMGKKGESEAHWVFDSAVSTIAPLNEVARWLIDSPEELTEDVIPTPRLVAVPQTSANESDPELPSWVTPAGQSDPAAQTMPLPKPDLAKTSMFSPTEELTETVSESASTPTESVEEKPNPKPKRASVPSWDEILFGSGSKTNE
ncbi:MAG: septation protein SepH [Candidatus Nanopelagicales bacterium]